MVTISRLLLPTLDILIDNFKPGKDGLALKDNQIVEAKVVKLLPQGKAELLIDGFSVEARTKMPLKEHETLFVKVSREEGKTVLKLMESYSPPKIQEGIPEMNSLGREGPYSSLTKIINPEPSITPSIEPEIEKPIELKDIAVLQKTITKDNPGLALDKFEKNLMVTKDVPKWPESAQVTPEKQAVVKTGIPAETLPSVLSGKVMPSDLNLLKAFITDKKIPFELKLAALITAKNPDVKPVPEEMIQDISTKLMESFPQIKKEQFPQVQSYSDDTPKLQTSETTVKLESVVEESLAILPPEEKVVINQIIENKALTWGEKTLGLIMGQKSEFIDEKELKPLVYMLKAALSENLQIGKEQVPGPEKSVQMPEKSFLPQNQDLKFEAIEEHPKSALNYQAEPERVSQRAHGRDGVEYPAIVRKIRDLLHVMSIKPEEPFDETNLKTMVRDSGLMWENKLRVFAEAIRDKTKPVIEAMAQNLVDNDVKALAMKGIEQGDAVSPKIAENLKTFVDNLEKMQVLNSNTSDDSGRYLLPLPYFSGETLKFGQLMVDLDRNREKEGKEGDRIVRVAFILEMTHLGHVKADVSVFRKSLTCEFFVENDEVKAMIEESVPELTGDLAQKGFSLRRFEVKLESPGTLATETLTNRLVNRDNHQVSILI